MNDHTDKLAGDLIRWIRKHMPTMGTCGGEVTLDFDDMDDEVFWAMLWTAIDADGTNREEGGK